MHNQMIRAAQAGQGGPVTIACINKATVSLGVSFDGLTTVLQKAYDTYFKPVWGYDVRLYNTDNPAASDWQFVYLDDADVANALGYHDLTINNQPYSKIFVRTGQQDGQHLSTTASHELWEMVIDPLANLWAQDSEGTLWAYEMADAVEEDTFLVDGLPISNFVHPSYFEPHSHPAGVLYDHMGVITAPFTTTKGGYSITMINGKIKNIFGSEAKRARFRHEDRRMHRSEYRHKHRGE